MQENNLQSSIEYIHFKLGLNYPKDFTIHDALIISRILSFQLNNKTYYESQNNLAKHLLTTRQLINRRIQFLIKQGWLVKDKSTIGETIFLSVAIDKLDNLSHYVTGGCNDMLQGGVTDCDRGCNAVLHKNKDIIQDNNKGESKDVTANAFTPPLELKPYLTLEQIKDRFKSNEYLDSIITWYEYRLSKNKPYLVTSHIVSALKKNKSNFPEAVKRSIAKEYEGIITIKVDKPRQEWQIRRDLKPDVTIFINKLISLRSDAIAFKDYLTSHNFYNAIKRYSIDSGLRDLQMLRENLPSDTTDQNYWAKFNLIESYIIKSFIN